MNASPLSRCGPLSLLGASLAPIIGAAAIDDARTGVVSVGVVVAAAALVVRDLRSTLLRLALGLVATVSIGVSTWLYGGRDLDIAVGASMRILFLVLPGAVLTPYLDPSALGDHLAQRLRLPPRVVVASVAALQRIDAMGQEWRQIERARRARGLGADGGPLNRVRATAAMSLALLVSTMRMSGRMSLAMDVRGFAGASRRTWAEPAPWTGADTVLLVAGLLLGALPLVLAR